MVAEARVARVAMMAAEAMVVMVAAAAMVVMAAAVAMVGGRGLKLDGGAARRSRRWRRQRRRQRQRQRRRRRRSNRCSRCPYRKNYIRLLARRLRKRHFLKRSTYWCRRPEGGMCRMRAGSWPTPRNNRSTRSGLFCKSCTAPIQQQCHQSRTSRSSLHPSRFVPPCRAAGGGSARPHRIWPTCFLHTKTYSGFGCTGYQ